MKNKEVLFYSPNNRAKLYSRFVFDSEFKHSNLDSFTYENSNYVCKHKFKWVQVRPRSEDIGKNIEGITAETQTSLNIKTNSLYEISGDDIVVINGFRYIIDGEPNVSYIYAPKYMQTFQYLKLLPLMEHQKEDSINAKHFDA